MDHGPYVLNWRDLRMNAKGERYIEYAYAAAKKKSGATVEDMIDACLNAVRDVHFPKRAHIYGTDPSLAIPMSWQPMVYDASLTPAEA